MWCGTVDGAVDGGDGATWNCGLRQLESSKDKDNIGLYHFNATFGVQDTIGNYYVQPSHNII